MHYFWQGYRRSCLQLSKEKVAINLMNAGTEMPYHALLNGEGN